MARRSSAPRRRDPAKAVGVLARALCNVVGGAFIYWVFRWPMSFNDTALKRQPFSIRHGTRRASCLGFAPYVCPDFRIVLMYSEAVQTLAGQAVAKLAAQRQSLTSHIVRSMLAGMYVGAAIVLILTIGSFLPPTVQKLVMGVCFGGALTIVIFAGSELFTGSNLVLTLGVLTGKASWRDLLANWVWTWIGNLMGSVLLAFMVVRSGILDRDPVLTFILNL